MNKNQLKPDLRYEMNKLHLDRMNRIKQRKNETLTNISYQGHPNEVHKRNREIERLNNIQKQNQNILSRLVKITVGGASFDHYQGIMQSKVSTSLERKSNEVFKLEKDYSNNEIYSLQNTPMNFQIQAKKNPVQQNNDSKNQNDFLKVSSCPTTPRKSNLNIQTESNYNDIHLPVIASSSRASSKIDNDRYSSVRNKSNPYKIDDIDILSTKSRIKRVQYDENSISSQNSIRSSNRKMNSSLDTYNDNQRTNKLKYHIKFSEQQPIHTQFKEQDIASQSSQQDKKEFPSLNINEHQNKLQQLKKKQPLIIEEIDWKDVQNQSQSQNYSTKQQYIKTKTIELDKEKDTIFTANAKFIHPPQPSKQQNSQN